MRASRGNDHKDVHVNPTNNHAHTLPLFQPFALLNMALSVYFSD